MNHDNTGRIAGPELLTYRPWHGHLRTPADVPAVAHGRLAVLLRMLLVPVQLIQTAWPITRTSLGLIFRRKLFWGLYALSMLVFLLYFFGQYLMAWARQQLGQAEVRVGGLGRANPSELVDLFSKVLKLDGSAETFRNFFGFEGYMVMTVLALAGSVLIGNDLRFGSLPFYLSKPLSRWHYLLGKGLAVAVFVNLLTTLPALVLFFQFGLLEPGDNSGRWRVPVLSLVVLGVVLFRWIRHGRIHLGWVLLVGVLATIELAVLFSGNYFLDKYYLALGILGYGAILTITLTLLLLALASWLQKTVPLIMTWAILFFFCRLLSAALVDGLRFDPRWRLIDLWNNAYLLGNYCLQIDPNSIRPTPQPTWYEAAGVLGGVCLLCLMYLILRIRAVEIVK
jgi:hypothetical protein